MPGGNLVKEVDRGVKSNIGIIKKGEIVHHLGASIWKRD